MKPSPFQVVDASFLYGMAPGNTAPESEFPEVAFAGRSNVGKSSLLNQLMNRRNLVRTSSTPGCTRQVNVFASRLSDGWTVHLVDLPGFGFARRSREERVSWGDLIETYLSSRQSLRMLVVLVDIRRGPEEEELMLLDWVRQARTIEPSLELLGVATKLDKVSRSQSAAAVKKVSKALGLPTIGFSAETGEGRDELWRAIKRVVGNGKP